MTIKRIIKRVILTILLIVYMAFFASILKDAIKLCEERYYAESACVWKYINRNVERRDIRTGEGTCWVVRR